MTMMDVDEEIIVSSDDTNKDNHSKRTNIAMTLTSTRKKAKTAHDHHREQQQAVRVLDLLDALIDFRSHRGGENASDMKDKNLSFPWWWLEVEPSGNKRIHVLSLATLRRLRHKTRQLILSAQSQQQVSAGAGGNNIEIKLCAALQVSGEQLAQFLLTNDNNDDPTNGAMTTIERRLAEFWNWMEAAASCLQGQHQRVLATINTVNSNRHNRNLSTNRLATKATVTTGAVVQDCCGVDSFPDAPRFARDLMMGSESGTHAAAASIDFTYTT